MQLALFRDLLIHIGQPHDCPELRERVRRLRRACVEATKQTSQLVLPNCKKLVSFSLSHHCIGSILSLVLWTASSYINIWQYDKPSPIFSFYLSQIKIVVWPLILLGQSHLYYPAMSTIVEIRFFLEHY